MRTRTTLAVRLVTRVTRVTGVDIPKTLCISVFAGTLLCLDHVLFFR